MTDQSQPVDDLDAAAANPAGGYDVAGIIGAIDDGVSTWQDQFEQIFALMSQTGVEEGSLPGPCYSIAHYRNFLIENYRPTLVNAEMLAARAAELGQETVRDVIRTYGRPGQVQAVNSTPFAQTIVNELGLDPLAALLTLLTGLPVAAATIFGWVDERIPQHVEGQLPPMQNRGVQLAPGWYLWAGPNATDAQHWAYGEFTGSQFRQAYLLWRDDMRSEVVPGQHNQWRDLLFGLTGRTRQDWRIWVAGDPVQPGSRLYRLLEVEANVEGYIAEATELCAAAVQYQREQNTVQGQAAADYMEQLGEAERVRAFTGPALALAAALVGIFFARSRR